MSDSIEPESELEPPQSAREELLEALAEIRSEARKAALMQAFLDALLVLIVCRLLLQLIAFDLGSETIISAPIPGGFTDALSGIGVILPNPITISAGGFIVTLTAGSWFAADFVIRNQRLDVEQFEAGNPAVSEALRTARDSAERDADSPIANELYRTVIERLQDTSSQVFVQRRQLLGVVIGIAVCSAAIVAIAGAGISLLGSVAVSGAPVEGGGGGSGAGGGGGGGSSSTGGEEDLLGSEGKVERGSQDQTVQLGGKGEGSASGGGDYSGGSFDVDPASVDASASEFTEEDRPENANLVRAYNRQIREGDSDE